MCLVCNRSSIAVVDEISNWFELNAVKGAADLMTALAHAAKMGCQYELVDHLGGDMSIAVEEGRKALELLDRTRARYAENIYIAREHGLNPKVSAKLDTWKSTARDFEFPGTDQEWTSLVTFLKKDNVMGLFGNLHNQLKELQDELEAILKDLEQGRFPTERFGPHMAKWNKILITGHYGGKVFAKLGEGKVPGHQK